MCLGECVDESALMRQNILLRAELDLWNAKRQTFEVMSLFISSLFVKIFATGEK